MNATTTVQPRGCTNLKLRQLSRAVTRHYDAYVARTGLKNTQYSLLSHVVLLGPIQPVELARRYDLPAPESVRWVDNQTTLWGSCTPCDRTIRVSSRMANFPRWVIDYVLVHELARAAAAQLGWNGVVLPETTILGRKKKQPAGPLAETNAWIGQNPDTSLLAVAPWITPDPGIANPGMTLAARRAASSNS